MTGRSAQLTPVARDVGGWQWLQSAAEMAALLSGYWPVSGTTAPANPVSPGRAAGPSGPGGNAGPLPPAGPTAWSSSPLVATRTPAPAASSVAAARTFTLRTLHRWGTTDCAEDVAAVVSELMTNALRHAIRSWAGGTSPIRLGLVHPGPCVLAAVADPSNDVPVPREPDWQAETGRGLLVIASLSHRWGYCPAPHQQGKVVWATVPTSSCLPRLH
jgi:anti-sigma regulatory factor (Ser/Thr protein kinase)